MSEQKKQKQQRNDFTPEQKLVYFIEKKAYWEGKQQRLLHPPKIAHAAKRVAYYAAKIEKASA